MSRHVLVLTLCIGPLGCGARDREARAASYEGVEPILAEHCAECHGGDAPAGGWSVDGVIETLGCSGDGGVPVANVDDGEPLLLAALSREDHAEVAEDLDADERVSLERWLGAGAPTGDGALHPPGWLDPRSSDWHGRAAARDRYARLHDISRPDACGRCHPGAPAVDPVLDAPPPGATPCTSCHDQPGGVFACATCHGDGERAAPPRDACLFPDGPAGNAHAAHIRDSALGQAALRCSECHTPVSTSRVIGGSHADGTVDVKLALDDRPAARLRSDEPEYDADEMRCSVGCHQHGGARETPRWDGGGPLGCGDCHGAPPADHYAGDCSRCHPGVDAEGSALESATFHLNGRVDLGVGAPEVGCGDCHGEDETGWPTTGAHAVHRSPRFGADVACTSCHVVPDRIDAEGHLPRPGERAEGGADVRFGERARARGAEPSYDPTTGTCSDVACHGAGIAGAPPAERSWREPAEATCGSCHGLPPAAPHPQEQSCEIALCHGGEVAPSQAGPRITEPGRAMHVDGVVQVGPEP